MRIVEKTADFAEALASCQREAINSFGDDAVLIEKYVQRPRHIEIQVFGDTHGNCVYLYERDCSVQRRHQKVLEEAPAPGMTEALRKQMGEAAVAAAKAVNYVGAGTVEFIVEQTGYDSPESMKFFFMEMNTRLQVEHPVTEAITGLDLVEWQLRVASGEPLPLRQDQLRIHGHAIEARICAENPDNNFLPATGTLSVYRKPRCSSFELANSSETGLSVRIDDGVREGDSISPFYDSMVAKLIVHGDTREQALARLDEALAQTRIVGLTTNVQFLRRVIQTESFATAKLDTALIQREDKALFGQEPLGLALTAAAVVASTLQREAALAGNDPFSRRDGWRAYGVATRRFGFVFHGQAQTALLTYGHDGTTQLSVTEQVAAGTPSQVVVNNAAPIPGELTWRAEGDQLAIAFAGQQARVQVFMHVEGSDDVAHVFAAHGATRITVVDALAHAGEVQETGGRLTAPMPGKVVSFSVNVGDKVKAGQPLAVMEAMKMEHTMAAPADGEVLELLYAPGDQVAEGAELLKLKTE
jgi:3-methylcrotonyl-CoA carboxylase alpha subunit